MRRLTPKKIEALKANLQQRLKELMEAAERAKDMSSTEQQFADPSDQAAVELDRARYLRVKDREAKLMRKIEKALKRIEDGSYGECEMCGVPIDLTRLEARPMADLCIDCATEAEGEKRRVTVETSSPGVASSFH